MDEIISAQAEQLPPVDETDYTEDIAECFESVPEVARPLIGGAGRLFRRIETMLYAAPALVETVRAAIPQEAYQVIFTDEQKAKIAKSNLEPIAFS